MGLKYIKLFEEIKAYHGSGKRFKDFKTSKMSSKIGQDTYGWGFYFTDSEDVAKIYANINDKNYVYHITLHKGKTPDQYDYLIFDETPTASQINKIKKGLSNAHIDLDLSKVKIGWDIISGLQRYFYESYDMKKQINGGFNLAKKETSLFLLSCGIDGLKYKMPNQEHTYEYGYDGYNYVVFDEKNIVIDRIK